MNFTVTPQHVELTNEQISDVLCCALDSAYGSSLKWIEKIKKIAPSVWEFNSDDGYHYSFDYPLNPGGALLISDEDTQDMRLDHDAIQRGLDILASLYSWHFTAIVENNADADTGDALLQCCLFGDIIYG